MIVLGLFVLDSAAASKGTNYVLRQGAFIGVGFAVDNQDLAIFRRLNSKTTYHEPTSCATSFLSKQTNGQQKKQSKNIEVLAIFFKNGIVETQKTKHYRKAHSNKSTLPAKDRLKLVLIHDRASLSPAMMDNLRRDLVEVISK